MSASLSPNFIRIKASLTAAHNIKQMYYAMYSSNRFWNVLDFRVNDGDVRRRASLKAQRQNLKTRKYDSLKCLKMSESIVYACQKGNKNC